VFTTLYSLITVHLTGLFSLNLDKALGNTVMAGDIGLFIVILLSIVTAGISLAMLIEIDMKANHRKSRETIVDDCSKSTSH